jgi:hypothetical protein
MRDTRQQSTDFDTVGQSQELVPLAAHPWRFGNSSPRWVWNSAITLTAKARHQKERLLRPPDFAAFCNG